MKLWISILVASLCVTEASHLRANRELVAPSASHCLCQGCTDDIWNTMAGKYSCGARISWLQNTKNYNEPDACRRVAGVEFPDECAACDPDRCELQSICGAANQDTCTLEVLEAEACDPAKGGCFSCAARIKYMIDFQNYSNEDACESVAVDEFPEVCGGCNPARETGEPSIAPSLRPSEAPTQSPTTPPSLSPTPEPTSKPFVEPTPGVGDTSTEPVQCGTSACTTKVLDAMACDDRYGGCYSCGDRITYFINQKGYDEHDACEEIAFGQFPSVCGDCLPDKLRLPPPPIDASKLVWSEEFDYGGVPDPIKWNYDLGTGDWGWGNNELQYYTDRPDNAYVSDGTLKIKALKEDFGGRQYTSARLTSKFKGDWKYGRIQTRVKLADGHAKGTWSAVWMLPTYWKYGGWPESGEIDIMEHVGYDSGRIHGTVHTGAFNHMKGTQDGGDILADTNDWHVHEIRWDDEKIDFVLDDFRFHTFHRRDSSTFQEWPFDEEFHLILNLAVGGTWGGLQGVDSIPFEGAGQVMEVDWIRVYSQ